MLQQGDGLHVMHAVGVGSLGAGLPGRVPSVCRTAGTCSGQQAHPGTLTFAHKVVLDAAVRVCVATNFMAHITSAYCAKCWRLDAGAWCLQGCANHVFLHTCERPLWFWHVFNVC